MSQFWNANKRYIYFILFAGILFVAFKYLLPLLGPLFLAFLVSFLIYPVAACLSEKIRIRRSILCVLILLLISLLLSGLILLIFYFVGRQGISFLQNGDTTVQEIYTGMNSCCCFFEKKLCLKDGLLLEWITQSAGKLQKVLFEDKLADLFSGSVSIAKIFAKAGAYLVVFFIGTVLLFKDMDSIYDFFKSNLHMYVSKVSSGIRSFLFAQIKIMVIIGAIAYLGLIMSGITKNVLYALFIAFLDVLPFIGTGIVLVPLSLYCFLISSYRSAIVLLFTYILCIIARQYFEPKLIGKQFGMPPFLTLAGIYLGVKVFGLTGILLGPAYFLILTSVYKEMLCNS